MSVGSHYEGGMTWDSRNGTDGMSVLEIREGMEYDEYMQRYVDELIKEDNKVASAVVALAIKDVA